MLKTQLVLSSLLVLMGSIDCVTTFMGVLYSGAKELNPFMAGIVSSNIGVFLVIKIGATILIASTYLLANRILTSAQDKKSKTFTYSSKILKIAYVGLLAFLVIVVANNLLILLA